MRNVHSLKGEGSGIQSPAALILAEPAWEIAPCSQLLQKVEIQ